MFFELSSHKILPLVAIVGVLVIAIYSFTYTDGRWSVLSRGIEYIEREQAALAYQFLYNPPWHRAAFTVASASGNAQAIPVLLYHGTPPEGNSNPPLPQNVFIDQLKALKEDGWQTITMEQFQAFMKSGTPVPAKSFLLTFDDGRKESFYPTDPVLKDLGYNAVMFVITGFSLPQQTTKPSSFYLDKTELQYMVDSGRWELESHGDQDHRLYDVPGPTPVHGVLPTLHQQHFLSNTFWLPAQGRVETNSEYQARVTSDLQTAQQILQTDFGKPVIAYAYPFNDYGQDTANDPQAIADLSNIVPSIYTFAFYQIDPTRDDPFNYPNAAAYRIKRIEPVASWSGADLVQMLDTDMQKTLPYHSSTWGAWSGNWGMVTQGTALQLRATANTTGAAALLNGSETWQNYSIDAQVDWKSGSDVSLIARYQGDTSTFLSCAFSQNRIVLEGHEHGTQTTIASTPYTFGGNGGVGLLHMSVQGNVATCSAYGASASATVAQAFTHTGSMGLQIWDEKSGTAALDVTHIDVRAL